jgi:hypothetical protein
VAASDASWMILSSEEIVRVVSVPEDIGNGGIERPERSFVLVRSTAAGSACSIAECETGYYEFSFVDTAVQKAEQPSANMGLPHVS